MRSRRRLSRLLAAVVVTSCLAVVAGAGSASAAPKPPSTTGARADSLGLAVTVTWSAVSGAAAYVVHRSSTATFVPSPATRLATVHGATRLRDDAHTSGRTLTYRVVALDAAGRPGRPGKAVTVTTGSGTAAGRDAATAWLTEQQDLPTPQSLALAGAYPGGHVGPVAGTATGTATLPGARTDLTWVGFDQAYTDAYVGPVAGVTGLAPAGVHVEVFSRPRLAGEPEYWQGSFPVAADGTWTSGEQIARGGAKIAHLVRDADGARLATSGGVRTAIAGVEVTVLVRTDQDYLQASSPLAADGSWNLPWVDVPASAVVLAHLTDTATGGVLASTEDTPSTGYGGLLRSFRIPTDDPARRALQDRSWLYDDALAVVALTAAGETARAGAVLADLAELQQPDGSLRFSYDVEQGSAPDAYTRTGASAWAGTAALTYGSESGDTTYEPFAVSLADALLRLQVTTPGDPRYGSLLGGTGWYDADGTFVPTPVAWASTEHNVDAYFFLRDLGYATGQQRFTDAAALVKASLLTSHWNEAEGRFDQGIGDSSAALDLGSWGGLFLHAVGENAKAASSAAWMERFRVTGAGVPLSTDPDSYNTTYASDGPISGYRPYGAGYADPPSTVWAEGTWGAILLKLRLGQDVTDDLLSMERLQAVDPEGGVLQVTTGRAPAPYEFHAWPAVAATGWAALVTADAGLLWKRDGWTEDAPG